VVAQSLRPSALAKVAFGLVLLGAGLAGAYLARERLAPAPLRHALRYPSPRALPAFALTREDGSAFGPRELAGRWSILYLGYSACPDLCPATMALLRLLPAELKELAPDARPQIYFLSIDPGHDGPAELSGYVHAFHPDFRGLTGAPEAVAAFALALGAPVLRSTDQGLARIDHSAALYLTDRAGRLAAVFPAPQVLAELASDYRSILARAGT
jgi:protein SCO1